MIKYQLRHTQLDQISDHKHDIYLYGKLPTELLVQAANENMKSMISIFPSLPFRSPLTWDGLC